MREFLTIFLYLLTYNIYSQCAEESFIGPNHRATYLLKLADSLHEARGQSKTKLEHDFFCSFPKNSQEYEQLFGYDSANNTIGPLNGMNSLDGLKVYSAFFNLTKINRTEYYDKFLNIFQGLPLQDWQNNCDPSGLSIKIIEEPKIISQLLEERKDDQIAHLFGHMLTCEHPNRVTEQYLLLWETTHEYPKLQRILNSIYPELVNKAPIVDR